MTLFGRATGVEQVWLRGVVTGEVRQGALEALVQEAVALAAGVPLAAVRRAAMLAGSTVSVVDAAFTGGETALGEVGLEVGRPVLPMLASSAPTVAQAIAKTGAATVAVDTKLDGIRIQVHRCGDEVLIATRSLDDITSRLPEVVDVALGLDATSFVLDGEALALDESGRPRPFQETASRTAMADGVHVTPFFFDVLHLDGVDLLDHPGRERAAALEGLVPPEHRVSRLVTGSSEEAETFARSLDRLRPRGRRRQASRCALRRRATRIGLGQGQAGAHPRPGRAGRGVGIGPPYRAGCPTSTSVLARRGADPFVMLGKTFKGMTDAMLALADRALPRVGDCPGGARGARGAGPGRRDRVRRRPAVDALPGRGGPQVRQGGPLPRRQERR